MGAWRLEGAYEGHEVVHFTVGDQRIVLRSFTVGVEEGEPWGISCVIDLGEGLACSSRNHLRLCRRRAGATTNGNGLWTVGGQHRAELDGCLDLDLEASVVTPPL